MLTFDSKHSNKLRVYTERPLIDYETELEWLIARAKNDGVVLPLVRDAERWAAYSKAAAEASHCKTPMEQIPFFQRLAAAAMTRFRSFTAKQFGEWVDIAAGLSHDSPAG